MTQTAKAMECPRCSEIALEHDRTCGNVATYECAACGHEETHVAGLPSWHPHSTEGTT